MNERKESEGEQMSAKMEERKSIDKASVRGKRDIPCVKKTNLVKNTNLSKTFFSLLVGTQLLIIF